MNLRNRCQLVAGCLLLSTFAMGLGSANLVARPQPPAKMVEVPVKTIEVLVAKQDLHAFQRLTDPVALLTRAIFRVGEEPYDAISSYDDLRGKVLRQPVSKGHPIARYNIYKYDVITEFPEGLQAAGLRIQERNLPLAVGQLPGKHVDIILHYKQEDGSFAKTGILRNVLVLAGSCAPVPESGGELGGQTSVILALAPEDVLTLVGAKEMGTLQLTLSNR